MAELKNIGVQDSVVEQLMGQIQNMEDRIISVLMALVYGPDMGTSYKLIQGYLELMDAYWYVWIVIIGEDILCRRSKVCIIFNI